MDRHEASPPAPHRSAVALLREATSADAVEQEELVRAFADPAFYPHASSCVEHVQPHISHVFLAGPGPVM